MHQTGHTLEDGVQKGNDIGQQDVDNDAVENDEIVITHNETSNNLEVECQLHRPSSDVSNPKNSLYYRDNTSLCVQEEVEEETEEIEVGQGEVKNTDKKFDALIAELLKHFDETIGKAVEEGDGAGVESDAIETQQVKNKGKQPEPIRIKYKRKENCDKDIFNPFKKDLNRFDGSTETRDWVLSGANSGGMKYDYRRDHLGTMDSGKNTAKHAMNYKKTYLFLYNLTMFIMFLMVHLILSIKSLTSKMDDDSVQGAAFIIKLLTYTQLMESIHPILGLVPGGPFMPFLQVIGRLLVNHFLSDPEIRSNSAPYAQYLFIVWSSIEIFRYSYYALRVFNVEIYPITWARYTLFMPLYPMGGLCEAQIVMATVEHLEKLGAYSLSLPNSANISFSLPSFLRFYTVILLGPSIIYLMKYMWNQRRKQLKEKIA